MKRHIVLIGLPGAGKHTVGRLVAEQLHAGFVDIDGILARREGKPITMIFAEKGEGAFRDMERKEMETALANEPAVLAPGRSTRRRTRRLTPIARRRHKSRARSSGLRKAVRDGKDALSRRLTKG